MTGANIKRRWRLHVTNMAM